MLIDPNAPNPADDPADIIETDDLEAGGEPDPETPPTAPAPDPAPVVPSTLAELTAWQESERERLRREIAPPQTPAAPPAPTPIPEVDDDLFLSDPTEWRRQQESRTQAIVQDSQRRTLEALAPFMQGQVQDRFVSAVDPAADAHQREFLLNLSAKMPGVLDPANQDPVALDLLRRASRDYAAEKGGGSPPPATPPPAAPPKPATPPAPMSPEPAYSSVKAGITDADRKKYGGTIDSIGEERFLALKREALSGN